MAAKPTATPTATPTMQLIEAIVKTDKLSSLLAANLRVLDDNHWATWRNVYVLVLAAASVLQVETGDPRLRGLIHCVAENHDLTPDHDVLPVFDSGGIRRARNCLRCDSARAVVKRGTQTLKKGRRYGHNADYLKVKKFFDRSDAKFVADMEGWYGCLANMARRHGVKVPANFHPLA